MRADALLVAECDRGGHTVLREVRSAAPLALIPRRAARDAEVRLVSSANTPHGGDDVTLSVRVGPGATLLLTGVAAALALPGTRPGGSRHSVDLRLDAGATLAYLPEPTVVTARAAHTATLTAELAADARLRLREVLVLGREGERAGRIATELRVTRSGRPLLHQRLDLDASTAERLAGRRVLATELLIWGTDPEQPVGEQWWSLTPLAAGGSLATALAPDAVTAHRWLDTARAAHPGWTQQ